jgi:hypothetical protein
MRRYLITFAALFASGLAYALEILPDSKVDTPQEVAAINNNFAYLNNGKLDLRPGSIIPKADSLYNLGASGTEWANLYVDSITARQIRVGSCGSPSRLVDLCGTDPLMEWIGSGSVNRTWNAGVDNSNGSWRVRDQTGTTNRLTIDTSGNVAVTTLNTGLGNYELYAMDQNVRTVDSPWFTTLAAGGSTFATNAALTVNGFIHVLNDSTNLGVRFGTSGVNNRWRIFDDVTNFSLSINDDVNDRTAILITSGTARRIHLWPSGTPDVELEVSNGASTGGGTVHAASFAAHSERRLKNSIRYLTPLEISQAYEDVKTLKPAEFRYKVQASTASNAPLVDDLTQPLHKGLIFDETPPELQGKDGTISLNDQIFMLQNALQVTIQKLEAAEARIKKLEGK